MGEPNVLEEAYLDWAAREKVSFREVSFEAGEEVVEGGYGSSFDADCDALGWLYIHVAPKTTPAPNTKLGVTLKLNKATLATNERMMLRLVAKPLRMLSACLMTMAVMSPPRTCTETVAHAQKPKFLNKSNGKEEPLARISYRAGRNAGRREKRDSWTFRTHKSAWEPLRTISK